MRALALLLGRLVLALGWLVFALVVALFAAEKTGLLTVLVRRALAERAGPLGTGLRIDHVSLRWFEARVELHGVRLGAASEKSGDNDAEDEVLLESASLDVSVFGGTGLVLNDVDIRGGHLRMTRELFARVRELTEKLPPRAEGELHTAAMPSITVRDLELDFETERFGRLPLGRVDARVRTGTGKTPVLAGRLVPTLSSARGATGEIFIAGQELENEPGAFDVSASAAGVPLSTDYVPRATPLDELRPYDPTGTLAVQASGTLFLDWRLPPRANVRASLTDGRLLLGGGRQPVSGLQLDLEASYAPKPAEDLWSLNAWVAHARVKGAWLDGPFEATARVGVGDDPAHWLAGGVHFPRVACRRDVVDLLGGAPQVEHIWQALEPRGEAELWAGIAWPRAWQPGESIAKDVEAAFEIGLAGGGGVTYHGFPSPSTGQRNQGFPLPVDGLTGSAVFASHPHRLRPVMLGIIDVLGRVPKGSAHVTGIVTTAPVNAPPYMPGYGFAELDLHVRAQEVPVDATLRSALAGLAGAVPPAQTWGPFDPAGGDMSADMRIVRNVDMHYAAAHLLLDIHDVGFAWADVPIPASRCRGRLEFRSDGRSESGVGASFEGSTRTAAAARIALRYQTDPSVPAPSGGKVRVDELTFISVHAERMSLAGDDEKILVTRFPFIAAAMDPMAPRGFADVEYVRSRPAIDAAAWTTAEITPVEAEMTPSVFPVPITGVRGRVLVSALEEPGLEARTETLVAPLAGSLSGDVRVAATARFPEGGVHVHGAGIDPANKSLLGALGQAIKGSGDTAGSDLTSVSITGTLDAVGEIVPLADEDGGSRTFRIFLRENSLEASKTFRLDHLRGTVEVRPPEFLGRRIEASLALTPIVLENVRFATSPQGFELTTELPRIERLPLDRDHLRPFVDDKTLDVLLGQLGWRGQLDVEDGAVRITGPRQGDTRLEFRGKLRPSDMQVQLGLPLSIHSASAEVEQLTYEGGNMRAVCRIRDLFGKIADRDLARAELLLTYVEPRLSIDNLEGELEGGRIRPLGGTAERAGTVFSIDLEDPFPFHAALDLSDVQLSGLLRGLLSTTVQTSGRLDCRLRLAGDTNELLAIQGTGWVQVRESRLWSVPVFRALFSHLGMDDQAVFDQLAANLRIRDGKILTDDITVHSSILKLVGKGSIDFDGTIHEDLQIRYGLVDRLGPLTRVLYAIQKQLLSVSIRGDLARPQVIFKNPWNNLFSRSDDYRALPLPSLSPLPPRF